jgi:flagellin-like hook-associated protein FlgL
MGSLRESLTRLRDHVELQRDGLEDADVVEVATDLAREQTLYEMTLAVSSKLLNLSLLDYL